tara:strand:- start:613 stop:849 length:237 start_codon:yes stop_codon:yes gene_type:complete
MEIRIPFEYYNFDFGEVELTILQEKNEDGTIYRTYGIVLNNRLLFASTIMIAIFEGEMEENIVKKIEEEYKFLFLLHK